MGNEQPFGSLPVRSEVRRSASLKGTVCVLMISTRGAGYFHSSAFPSPLRISELSTNFRRRPIAGQCHGVQRPAGVFQASVSRGDHSASKNPIRQLSTFNFSVLRSITAERGHHSNTL